MARWRHAGYAETGTLATGPPWCWLTAPGMKATGLTYPATRPALGRLARIRAVLAVRLWLQASAVYQDGRPWWRSERHIRAALGGPDLLIRQAVVRGQAQDSANGFTSAEIQARAHRRV